MQGRLLWGAGWAANPLILIHGGTLGARISLRTKFFPSLLSSKGAFSGTVDILVQENYSGGKPPDPQSSNILLGDQYTKLCSS